VSHLLDRDADQMQTNPADTPDGNRRNPWGDRCLPRVLFGAGYRTRTDDLLFTREMLFQLS
jgi:hypothetical protein